MFSNMNRVQQGVVFGASSHVLVLLIGTFGFSIIEKWSLLDSFYMTIISVTTVGYGEVHPMSDGGHLFASIVILGGLGTIFFTTTMLGRMILEGEFRGTMQRRQMKRAIENLKDHHIVCGYGRTGRIIAETLHADGIAFCVIDGAREVEPALVELGYPYVIGDATEEAVLKEAGIEHAAAVMALLSSDADNLYLTIAAKELNPTVKLVARAFDEAGEKRLTRAGADVVVAMNKIAGHRVLQAAVRPTVSEFFDLVSDREQLNLILEEIHVNEGSSLIDHSLEQAGLRSDYGVIIVAIKKRDGEMLFNPAGSIVLQEGDILIAIGEDSGLKRLSEDCKVKTGV